MLRSIVARVGKCNGVAVDRHTVRLLRPSMACLNVRPATNEQRRGVAATAHAIANPKLVHIEKRWEAMQPEEQAELWMELRDRMKLDWQEMTWQEKKAAYWIAFGPHGPRAVTPPGENWLVFKYTMLGVAAGVAIFAILRQFAKEKPKTMTREWQEMTNEYLRSQNVEPITGLSSEGYKGEGMVQGKSTNRD